MECQILFSGKNKKNIINLSSAENAQRVVKVKNILLVYTGVDFDQNLLDLHCLLKHDCLAKECAPVLVNCLKN